MRLRPTSLLVGVLLAAPAACAARSPAAPARLVLERTIPLGHISGRIDHLVVDPEHGRVFIAELGAGSVSAVDLQTGQVRRIQGLQEPQGLAYLQDRNVLVVACGGDGTVRFFDAGSLAPLATLRLGDDADDVRIDPTTGRVVVGYGAGALAIINPATRTVIGTVPLPAHPEGFEIDAEATRAFVNLPNARAIAVVDMAGERIASTLPATHRWNYPLAFSPATRTIGVVYRFPSRLTLLDATSGKRVQELPTCGDADDLFFDEDRRRVYVSCGSGRVDVFQRGATAYAAAGSIATRPGARTSVWAPRLGRLFVAAPARGASDAALLVYRPVSPGS